MKNVRVDRRGPRNGTKWPYGVVRYACSLLRTLEIATNEPISGENRTR